MPRKGKNSYRPQVEVTTSTRSSDRLSYSKQSSGPSRSQKSKSASTIARREHETLLSWSEWYSVVTDTVSKMKTEIEPSYRRAKWNRFFAASLTIVGSGSVLFTSVYFHSTSHLILLMPILMAARHYFVAARKFDDNALDFFNLTNLVTLRLLSSSSYGGISQSDIQDIASQLKSTSVFHRNYATSSQQQLRTILQNKVFQLIDKIVASNQGVHSDNSL